jgi:ubiquinone/menaquinone biosynthesis C-methylase UbiE
MRETQYEYSTAYIWTDRDILEGVIRACDFRAQRALDVACGPNRAIELALEPIEPDVRCLALDLRPEPLYIRRGRSKALEGVVADATRLPFVPGAFDAIFYHHAIDDIIETRGKGAIPEFIGEGIRALRSGGTLAFSHALLSGDPYTEIAGLEDVRVALGGDGKMRCIRGNLQDWLIYEKP